MSEPTKGLNAVSNSQVRDHLVHINKQYKHIKAILLRLYSELSVTKKGLRGATFSSLESRCARSYEAKRSSWLEIDYETLKNQGPPAKKNTDLSLSRAD